MSTLLIAEHQHTALLPASARALSAALKLGAPVTVLVAGDQALGAAEEAARLIGVASVIHVDAPHYRDGLAEELSALTVSMADAYEAIVMPANVFGRNILPRVAASLDIAPITDVVAIESPDTFVRPIYAGNALARIKSLDSKRLLSVRPTSFEAAMAGGTAPIHSAVPLAPVALSHFVGRALSPSDRPDLNAARVVVSGGRALQSAENFKLIEALADKLQGAVGASRAAVDAGYVANDRQVGQTGTIVAPELYIAVGISGAVQHLAGMKDSQVIVAINKDPEAPIFKVADYGLVADLFEAVPQLIDALG